MMLANMKVHFSATINHLFFKRKERCLPMAKINQRFHLFNSVTDFLKQAKPVPFDYQHDECDLLLITADGQSIYNFDTHNFLKPYKNSEGYLHVKVLDRETGKYYHPSVHGMVADAFVANPNHLPYVHHIDLDRANNDVSNLLRVDKETHLKLHTLYQTNRAKYFKQIQILKSQQIML